MSTKYRIQILPDMDGYEIGDAEEADREQIGRDIERHGVWGYVVEKWVAASPECPECGVMRRAHWEHVDSCWGFIGNDDKYMMSQALESIPDGTGEVSVVDENGNEINTVTK